MKAPSPVAMLIHGTDDTIVHPREASEFAAKLRATGVPVECRIYARRTHFDTVAAFSLPLRMEAPTLADVTHFINRTMAADAAGKVLEVAPACAELRLRREWSPGTPVNFNGG